jgi:hypothetical protein
MKDKKFDLFVRNRLGCDRPAERTHLLPVGRGQTIEVQGCPRKCAREANEFLRIYNWAENHRLEFLYAPDAMPAKIGEALDLIEFQVDVKTREAHEKTQAKIKAKERGSHGSDG